MYHTLSVGCDRVNASWSSEHIRGRCLRGSKAPVVPHQQSPRLPVPACPDCRVSTLQRLGGRLHAACCCGRPRSAGPRQAAPSRHRLTCTHRPCPVVGSTCARCTRGEAPSMLHHKAGTGGQRRRRPRGRRVACGSTGLTASAQAGAVCESANRTCGWRSRAKGSNSDTIRGRQRATSPAQGRCPSGGGSPPWQRWSTRIARQGRPDCSAACFTSAADRVRRLRPTPSSPCTTSRVQGEGDEAAPAAAAGSAATSSK